MNVLLEKHGTEPVCKIPEGLRELCADIAREVRPMKLLFDFPSRQKTIKLLSDLVKVLRSQPRNIYCFVADYVEALLITRENAKGTAASFITIFRDIKYLLTTVYSIKSHNRMLIGTLSQLQCVAIFTYARTYTRASTTHRLLA